MRFTFNLRKLGTGAGWPSSIPRRLSSNLQRADLTVLKDPGSVDGEGSPFHLQRPEDGLMIPVFLNLDVASGLGVQGSDPRGCRKGFALRYTRSLCCW